MNTAKRLTSVLFCLAITACAEQSQQQLGEQNTPSNEGLVRESHAAPASTPTIASAELFGADASARAISLTDAIGTAAPRIKTDRENYAVFEENAVTLTLDEPVSTFSIDVDTAAYSNVRRMLQKEGRLPPSHAVKVEEMLNYFNYQYPRPKADEAFSVTTELAPTPWAEGRQLLRIGLKGYEQDRSERPSSNLVFLIDVSGSMNSPDKLGLVKKSLSMLTRQMRKQDRIALVVYAGAAGLVLESTPGDQKTKILSALDKLTAGGSTHGSAGIELAYEQASEHFIDDGINRVIIASDGDMNVGTVNLEALTDLVARKRKTGISLTTLGFGSGNYNYALMEQLADHGNGNAAYIDSIREAQKVLVTELDSTLHTIASDVKIQIEFNPAVVAEYRLLGYENRLLRREDFRNDKVDAGEIGAGHTVTALYEITPSNSEAMQIPPLRYERSTTAAHAGTDDELAFVRLRYKPIGSSEAKEIEHPVFNTGRESAASSDFQFAAAVAGFGSLLKNSSTIGNWNYDDVLELARAGRGEDPHGYRGEFVALVELARNFDTVADARQQGGDYRKSP